MGNCLAKSEKLTAEIVPHDGAHVYPAVRLYGSPKSIIAAYIRFALLHKSVPLDFVPTSEPETATRVNGGGESELEAPVMLQVGSETVSGSREALLRFIDSRFPNPPLTAAAPPKAKATATASSREIEDVKETTPLMVSVTQLHHKSMLWHVERLLRWAEDMAARGGKKAVAPSVGTPRMEIRKFARSYSQLLEVMLEHAQMEERVLFPIFDMADRGLSKAAKEEHARDLPMMNGIKEDIKCIGVLDSGNPGYRDALCNLSTRLKSFQGHCKQHFKEEEEELLPLMEAVELTKEEEESALEHCLDVMQGTHSRLLKFLLEGLPPHDAMKYLDLIGKCRNKERMESMLGTIIE
ncbi:hypothetical protein L6164_007109 [Bauhinia variegata]|uniref:Uncharacterized protein n=1 Tax=Bauhinia variegata TaxID=167791 RepID=A0ACB9PVZ4_BAUVA|nr:hypothetical protein L6164_007109 [Bauhinia variegata]